MKAIADDHQGFLPTETFKEITDSTPLISIDFIVTKANRILLGKTC